MISPDGASALDSIPWERILRNIHHGQVLPIIGPGLVTVEHNGKEIPFVDYLAPLFAERLAVPAEENSSLGRAACAHLVNHGARGEIYEELRELVEDHENLPLPAGLRNLAAIRDFDLFITSTFDGMLARALKQARPGYKDDSRGLAWFHPNKPVDLPETYNGAFVYHILGSYKTYPDFAVWEEDYMEFLCGLLQTPNDARKNLFRELRNRSLLLIGAPFGDWMVRFFLRIAKQERLSDRRGQRSDYIAGAAAPLGEPTIFYFDKVIGSPQIIPADPAEFIAELHRRWAAKYSTASAQELLDSIPDDMDRHSVFISYANEDIEAAASLAAALKAAGIPVWLDRRRLQAGGDYEVALIRAVKTCASLFVSLISANSESNAERYVHKERRWAAEMHVPGNIFYIPVVIDDTANPVLEPAVFEKIHRHRLPDGEADAGFIKLIRGYYDQYLEHGEVRGV